VNTELLAYLQLINTDNIGPVTCRKLIQKYGSAEAAVKSLPSAFSLERAKEEVRLAKELGVTIITLKDKEYPQKLADLEDAPPVLYLKGNISLLNHTPAVVIVGARNASINSRKITSRIAFDLTNHNVLIISGMARGIDSAAHKGAMYALNQQGPTIAVLGTGIDKVYPKENEDLYQQIAMQGLLVSEFPFGTSPQTGNFPRRNRIVAALADGVLVTEATEKSGSLITAKQAISLGKPIFAVPGSPSEPRASGSNMLLRHGAALIENAEDILKALKNKKSIPISPLPKADMKDLFIKPLDFSEKTADISSIDILTYLGTEGTDIDEVIRTSGLDAATVSMQIIDLEMEDKIVRLPGNKIALNAKKMKVKK